MSCHHNAALSSHGPISLCRAAPSCAALPARFVSRPPRVPPPQESLSESLVAAIYYARPDSKLTLKRLCCRLGAQDALPSFLPPPAKLQSFVNGEPMERSPLRSHVHILCLSGLIGTHCKTFELESALRQKFSVHMIV